MSAMEIVLLESGGHINSTWTHANMIYRCIHNTHTHNTHTHTNPSNSSVSTADQQLFR